MLSLAINFLDRQSELAEKQKRRESEILDIEDDEEFQELISMDHTHSHDLLSQSHNDDDLMLELEEYISTSWYKWQL